MFDALRAAGFIVLWIGLIALGVAMLGTPAFGKGFGWVGMVLGVVGPVAATFNMVESSMVGALSFFAMIIFFLVLG